MENWSQTGIFPIIQRFRGGRNEPPTGGSNQVSRARTPDDCCMSQLRAGCGARLAATDSLAVLEAFLRQVANPFFWHQESPRISFRAFRFCEILTRHSIDSAGFDLIRGKISLHLETPALRLRLSCYGDPANA
jgi:hypothetical protein